MLLRNLFQNVYLFLGFQKLTNSISVEKVKNTWDRNPSDEDQRGDSKDKE